MAEKKTVLLRLNRKIWEEISRWADEEFRSVNGQIEYLLQEAIRKHRKRGFQAVEHHSSDDPPVLEEQ